LIELLHEVLLHHLIDDFVLVLKLCLQQTYSFFQQLYLLIALLNFKFILPEKSRVIVVTFLH